jgi:cysteine-rich repeat protein
MSICFPECGDGKIKGSETCDDKNLDDGDGCSAKCTV